MGSICCGRKQSERYAAAISFLPVRKLDAETAKAWGAVNEVVPADKLLLRAREIAEGLATLPPLTTRYTRIAMTQKLRRIIDEGVTLGLALEGISAADVARASAA
jgi:enoyl-CoA hydratase/carnithine racemase